MSFIRRIRSAYQAFRQPTGQRFFNAAQGGRLYSDWIAAATSADTELRSSYRRLIDRSRDLERNNDYMRGFLLASERNILGAQRNDLRMDAGEYVSRGRGEEPVWQTDSLANRLIEQAWQEWGKKGTCTVCGRYSWRDVKRLAVRAVPRDGNFLARKVRGRASRNRFNFALQIWEIDHLDMQKNDTLRDGGRIRFGVESDMNGRVRAFWLMARNPGDFDGGSMQSSQSVRVPADEVYHLYLSDRAEQTIGYPWVVSAITRLRQLGAFEEAAVVAARLGASSSVFFQTGQNGGTWTGDTLPDGRAIMDVEPGTAQSLPQDWTVANYTPPYPNIQTGDFRKAMLRGIATPLGMSYNTLGNDLESVNFSSARVGLFEEREGWKFLQSWYAEGLWEPIFGDWLETALAEQAINLPLAKFAKFNRPIFKARRWPFIDPLKEVEAAKAAISLRIGSRRGFIEEAGGDVEEVFHDNLDDERLAESLGLDLTLPEEKQAQKPDEEPEAAPDKP